MKKIKIGLVGLGVVGKSVYEILIKDKKIIDAKTLNELELVAVSARGKKDFIDENKVKFYANALDLANDPTIDVVVEVVGGEGIAREVCEAALKNGKKFVTANKALIATRGVELSDLAEKYQSHIYFEAGVGGATPMIKIFKESLAANKIKDFYAILNGTCNYILTKMKNENVDFASALQQAQALGYAESDPTFDIEGIDTAHKLTILSAIASGSKPDFYNLFVEGISEITIDDICLADELVYKIKLIAVYKNGGAFKAVYPALVCALEKIANVDESFNAILTKSSNSGNSFVVGSGAGGIPTASAIVADLIDIANDRHNFIFGVKSFDIVEPLVSKIEDRLGRYFIKLVLDKKLAQEQKLDPKFLKEIKVEKSYFSEKKNFVKSENLESENKSFFQRKSESIEVENDEIICALLTFDIQEKTLVNLLKNLDKNLVKEVKFLRVEETKF